MSEDAAEAMPDAALAELRRAARAFEKALNVAGTFGIKADVLVYAVDVSTIQSAMYAYTVSMSETTTRSLYP